MAENDEPTPAPEGGAPAPAETAPEQTSETAVQPAAATEAASVAAEKQKFTDRLWNFRAMVAVALAALLLGGGTGAAIAAVSHDDGNERHPGFMRFQDGPGGPMMGPGANGFGPRDRKELRQDMRDMRQKMREHMKEQLEEDESTPTPSPSETPNG